MMEPATYDALAQEIDRITTCPYPCQLRTLRGLVDRCSDSDIARWGASNPCMVGRLASCLIDGLQQWSYVLDMVTKFANNQLCRDAFLQHEPTLLHSVLVRAVKSGATKSVYIRASVALLYRPLPDAVALPAEVQTLFVQLVEEAAERPSRASIEPVYRLLTGAGSLLLTVLSNETLIRFEEHLINILKREPGTADLCLSLYCFSIMKQACSSADEEFRWAGSSYSTQDFLASTAASPRWKSESMQQFFTGSKAMRSMQLVVLLVLQASSNGSSSASPAERIRALALANEVITAIPADIRKKWCSANATTIRKLQEKVCVESLDRTTRTLALRFLGKLCELDALARPVREAIQLTFLESGDVQLMHTLCPRVDDRELFAAVLMRAPIGRLLHNALNLAIRAESAELATGSDAIARSVREASIIIEEQKVASHEIGTILNEPAFAQSLQQLRELLPPPLEHGAQVHVAGRCLRALHRMRLNLAHEISDLLLRAYHRSATSPHSTTLLLDLHTASVPGDVRCAHKQRFMSDPIAFGETDGGDLADLMDWREAIHAHFQARASVEQDEITRVFARACASLEARCEDVERPLRNEQEKRRAVEQQNEQLTEGLSELEARHVSFVVRTRDLEEERDQYLHDLEESRDENSQLLERISSLERKVREAQAQSERQLAEMGDAQHMNELDNAAVLARKEEELEDLQEQLQQTTRDANAKEREILALQNDVATAQDGCQRWKEIAASNDTQIHELQASLRHLERTSADLQVTNSRLGDDLKSAVDESADQSRRLADLETKLEAAQAQHEETRTTRSREAEEAASAQRSLESQLAEQQSAQEHLESQLATLQHTLDETTAQFASDLETRTARIAALQKKITRLQRTGEQKDHQISSAQAMRANLMAAMGLSGSPAAAIAIAHRSRESAGSLDPATPPTPASVDADATDIDDSRSGPGGTEKSAEESFESRAPAPKRARPGGCAVEPSMAGATKTRASTATGKAAGGKGTRRVSGRLALGVVSGNAGMGKGVVFRTPEEGGGDDGDATFDGSEVIAGTQCASAAGELEEEG